VLAGITGGRRWWTVSTISRVDPLEVNRRNPKVGMPELPLNNRQRNPFVRHLDRMSMPQLVRREPTPHPGLHGEPAKLSTRGGRRPAPPACGAGEDAEQRADRELDAVLGPAGDVLPCPVVHPDCPALPALPLADEHRPGLRVQIGLGERERFADPQPGAPQDRDQPTLPVRIWPGPAWRITRMISSTVGGSAG
jgi:hypothetical protein